MKGLLPWQENDSAQPSAKQSLPTSQKIINLLSFFYLLLSLPTLWKFWHNTVSDSYSPVRHLLAYESQPLHEEHEALMKQGYVGRPENTQKNWDRLLEPMNFKATEEELHRANIDIDDKVVKVSGGGYVGVLSVYHELHCLDALRKSTLRPFYYPNMTIDNDERIIEHLTHCIEYIRRTIMCHADVTVYTASWIADSHENPNKDLVSGGERTCVKWDDVDKWSRQRALMKRVYKVKPGPYEKDLHPKSEEY